MRLLDVYFEHCHALFTESRKRTECEEEFFFTLADRLTINVRFGRSGMSRPFRRSLEHLETAPVESPDLTICVWDSHDDKRCSPAYPSWNGEPAFNGHTFLTRGDVLTACEFYPDRMSFLDRKRNLGLYWISDIDEFPWYEQCRPLRNILHWWSGRKQLQLVHAACVGTKEQGILIVGNAGAGKSTTALSVLETELSYLAEDLCLIGLEGGRPYAYSLYNTGKLEHFDRLGHLEKFVSNPDRKTLEKAVLYLHECFSEKMLDKVPICAIVSPSVTDEPYSSIAPTANSELPRLLARSTISELIGAGPADLLGIMKVCATIPAYTLHAGSRADSTIEVLAELAKASGQAEKALQGKGGGRPRCETPN